MRGLIVNPSKVGIMRFVLKRLALFVVALFGLSVVVFAALRILPGDVASVMAGVNSPPERVTQLREQLGLNRPLIAQYFDWMSALARGDFGTSILTGRSVTSLVGARASITFPLIILGLLIALAIGLPLGCAAVLARSATVRAVFHVLAIVGGAVPALWGGLSQYTDGVASAADGVAALDAGANQLSSGINALSDTFKSQILTGVAQLADGADALVGGIQNQLIPGANTLSAGIDKLSATLNGSFSQIKSNADTYGVKYQTALTSAKTLETAATTTLPNGATLNDILTQVGQLAGGVDMTIKTATDLSGDLTDESKVTALFTKYITAYTAAVKLDTLSAYNTAIKAQLDTVNGTISQITGGAYTKLDSLYTAEMGLLLQAVSNGGVYTALNTVYNTATQTVDPETGYNLSQSLEALSNGAKQLIGGLGQIKDGAGQISLGAKKLKMGIGSFDELNPAAETVCSALYKLQAGGSQLTGGTKQLGDGLSTLKSNNETLNSGASALKAGTSQLRSASATLADGVDQLAEGSITLKDGMIEFNETGVQKLANLVKNDAQDAVDTIKKIVELGNDYQSFAGKSDDVKGTVKFIYKTEGITK